MLDRLKSLMWDHVGVVQESAKHATASSEIAALRDEADALWERGVIEGEGGDGCGTAAVVQDTARTGLAMAEVVRANPVSGETHYAVSKDEEEEEESDEEEGVLVAARAWGGSLPTVSSHACDRTDLVRRGRRKTLNEYYIKRLYYSFFSVENLLLSI